MKIARFVLPIALPAFVAGTLATGQAHALPIIGGLTSVELTAAPTLSGAGLAVSTTGTALSTVGTNGIPLFYFPVTGGTINTDTFAALINHNGSGLRLTTSTASMNLSNFVIDTVLGTLSGAVSFGTTNLSGVPLFSLSASGVASEPFRLSLTAAAAGALSTVFGVPNLTGVALGNANTIPIAAAVPEPATYLSMALGLGLIALMLGRRRSAVDRVST
jgi:hypothetical protein